jgi:RNA polymerase sigma-70 factor (ECF subfamily)
MNRRLILLIQSYAADQAAVNGARHPPNGLSGGQLAVWLQISSQTLRHSPPRIEFFRSSGNSLPRPGFVTYVEVNVEDEQILIERLRAKDEAAFTELVERYYGYLLPLADFFVTNRAVAEEIVQEAWLAVLNGIDRFEQRSSFKTWISRIVMNLARTRGVRESRMVSFSEFAEKETESPEAIVDPLRFRAAGDDYPDHWSVAPRPWNVDPEKQLLSGEMLAVLEHAIESLPEAQRLVLTMRDVNGWTAEEVCNVLAVSETNQRVLLHRARSKVRGILETYFSTSDPQRKRGSAQHQEEGRNRDATGTDLQGIDGTDHRLPGRALIAN